MLNRHILRIKAMQNAYGFEQLKKACFFSQQDALMEQFSPVLHATETLSRESLQEKQENAKQYFEAVWREKPLPGVSDDVALAANLAIDSLKQDIERERKRILTQVISEIEKLPSQLASVLKLVQYMQSRFIERETQRSGGKRAVSNFEKNTFIEVIKHNVQLNKLYKNSTVHWEHEMEHLSKWLKDFVISDEEFNLYQDKKTPNFQEDAQIVSNILRKRILKEELTGLFFEEKDLAWAENKNVIRSMVNRMVKETQLENYSLPEALITVNWQDDKEFFSKLYDFSTKENEYFEEIIRANSKNWDIERIASLDRIILRMAMNEFVHFSSIPVKVTINEYIEISKKYSTPKSKQFINGMLDAIVLQLKEKKLIKKSGRGLMDNK